VTAGHAPYLAPLALSATLAVGLARSRYAHPTAPERAMIGMLDELGQREGADYDRAYRGAPGVYADFAWPEQQLAIKGHGSAHDAAFFLARGWAEREARRAVVYADTGWSVRVVTARHLAEERAQTVARVREAVMPPDQGQREYAASRRRPRWQTRRRRPCN
jgi:hypothetical protein